jgi:uncharacterized membrane protein YcaP (DUF421 family)
VRARIALTGKQWLGLPLLAVPPVLAVLGLLGPGRAGVVGRTALVFGFLLAALRILGKRDLSQMTPFDAVLLFLIPQLFRNYLVATDHTLWTALVSACTLLLLVFVTSLVAFKNYSVGRLVRARPTVLLERGDLVPIALDRERVTPAEIEAAARHVGLASLDQVDRATLESDGSITILPRPGARITIPQPE